MADFKPMREQQLWTCEVRYEVYKGKAPLTMKPTGRFAWRPPFIVRDSEIRNHLYYRFDVTAVQQLNVGAQFIDRSGSKWTRTK